MVEIYKSFFTMSDVKDDSEDLIPDDEMLGDASPSVKSSTKAETKDDGEIGDEDLNEVRDRLSSDAAAGKLNREGGVVEISDDEDEDDIPY